MAKVPLPEMEKMYEAVFRSLRKTGRGRGAIRFRFAYAAFAEGADEVHIRGRDKSALHKSFGFVC